MIRVRHVRSGTTLVELLLFLAFFAVVGGSVISILFATSEQRARQRTVSSVERTGLQALQALRWRMEHAERILGPQRGSTGSILSLQIVSDADNPLIAGVENGTLTLIMGETSRLLTPPGMTVSRFTARNVSPADDRPTVLLSFDLTAAYPLPSSPVPQYTRHFVMAVQLLPKDEPTGNGCGCSAPSCNTESYVWGVCEGETCRTASVTLPCP